MKFRYRLSTSFNGCRQRGLCFLKSTLLNSRILFVFRQLLERFKIGKLRSELLVGEAAVNGVALPDDRFVRFELADRGRDGINLRLFLLPLAIERGDLARYSSICLIRKCRCMAI